MKYNAIKLASQAFYRQNLWLAGLCCLPILGLGQVKLEGRVVDAVSKQPISYVNLECFRYKMGTQSNPDGTFTLELPKANVMDTLKISCVGYESKYITQLHSNPTVTYELVPASVTLPEVVIRKGKTVLKEVGVLKKGRSSKFFGQILRQGGFQYAILLKNTDGKTGYLKKIHFYMGAEGYDAPFRIRIYENDNHLPGKDILHENLEWRGYQKKAWNSFDVSQHHIHVPENGIWVAVEWIKNAEYLFTNSISGKGGDGVERRRTITYYGPEIVLDVDTPYGFTYQKALGGKWFQTRVGAVLPDKQFKYSGYGDLLVKGSVEVVE